MCGVIDPSRLKHIRRLKRLNRLLVACAFGSSRRDLSEMSWSSVVTCREIRKRIVDQRKRRRKLIKC